MLSFASFSGIDGLPFIPAVTSVSGAAPSTRPIAATRTVVELSVTMASPPAGAQHCSCHRPTRELSRVMPYAAQLSPVPRNPLRGPSVIVVAPGWSAAARSAQRAQRGRPGGADVRGGRCGARVPVGTLRSRLFRRRKQLFVALQDYARARGYMKVVELTIEKAAAPG